MKLTKENYDWAKLLFTNKLDLKLYGYTETDYNKVYWVEHYIAIGYLHDADNKYKRFFI